MQFSAHVRMHCAIFSQTDFDKSLTFWNANVQDYIITFMIVGQFSEFKKIKAHDMPSALSLAMIHSTQFKGKHIHEVRVREVEPETESVPAIPIRPPLFDLDEIMYDVWPKRCAMR